MHGETQGMMADTPAKPTAASLSASSLAQHLLALFPLLLFMPQGVVNGGLALYLLLLLFAGQWRDRLNLLRAHPFLAPALAMLALCVLSGVFIERPADFGSGFVHYQDYLLVFIFMAAGPGTWQQRAVRSFYLGATVAGVLLFLARAELLPVWSIFAAYNKYSGNKSIVVAMLMAVAACWMLAELMQSGQRRWRDISRFAFVALAVVLVAQSRTAQLILLLGCAGTLLWVMRDWRLRLASVLAIALLAALAVQNVPQVKARMDGTMTDLRAFAHGGPVSDDGQRLSMYRATLGLIAEKPLTGHGIGGWFPHYKQRIQGTAAPLHSTPHSDYLLYLAELGLPGLVLLGWAFWVQASMCRRLQEPAALQLATLTVALMVGAMFNAMLRDFAFAIPFMFLLATLVTGMRRQKAEP